MPTDPLPFPDNLPLERQVEALAAVLMAELPGEIGRGGSEGAIEVAIRLIRDRRTVIAGPGDGPAHKAHGPQRQVGWLHAPSDVEVLAAGWLRGRAALLTDTLSPVGNMDERVAAASDAVPPWDSEDLSNAVGVDPDQFDRHTALGDARWAKAIYERILG